MNVGIVGLGTAGSAAALFLSRAGHRVDLFERTKNPGPVGAGIMMQPSGLLVLERLGCAEPITSHGSRVDALVATTTQGTRVLDLAYGDLDASLFGIGLHRGVLFETLFDAVNKSRATVHLGVDIVKMRSSAKSGLVDSEGRVHGPYDLLVLADGARSHLRDALFGVRAHVAPYPWGAMWFIGESRIPRRELAQFLEGTHHMIGVLPTGRGPGHGGKTLASLFFSVEIARRDEVIARGLDAWKREILRVAPRERVGDLLDQISSFDDLTFASYFDVAMPRWHCRHGATHVVLLGDAAHATSPQLGQGCNLALCDAAELSDSLEKHEDIEHALTSYSAARREHLAFYQLATRAITPFFQSDSAAFGLLRDFFSPIATRVPFVRREMIRTMCGTKTGWLFGARETRMPR